MPTLNVTLQEYERHFQEYGDILRNAAYFAINVVNKITKSIHNSLLL